MTNKVSWLTKPFQDNTSVVKKSAAIKVSQWLCRNWRQLVDLPRSGAGSNPVRKRMLSTVESLNLNPRLSKAPTMRLLPQVGFSWSSLTTSFSSAASTGARPMGLVLAKVHFLATRTRNQRKQGIGSDKGGPSPQAASADELGFARQPDALGVGEALGFATELFQENPVFFLEVYNDSLLVSAHPAGDRDEQELELRRHRVENLSKVLVAQSSIGSRLNFLAIGSCFGIFDHLGQCSSVTKARKQSALDGEMNCFGKTRWKLLFDSAHRFFCNFLNFRQCFACERPRQSSAFGGLHKMPTPNILDLIVPTDPDRHCQFHLFTLDLAVVQARLRCQNVI